MVSIESVKSMDCYQGIYTWEFGVVKVDKR